MFPIVTSTNGVTVTHVDALCHMWDGNGMWNGRGPAKETGTSGPSWGDITQFGDGLITRGVLIDLTPPSLVAPPLVPRHRRVSHVTPAQPVTGNELEAR